MSPKLPDAVSKAQEVNFFFFFIVTIASCIYPRLGTKMAASHKKIRDLGADTLSVAHSVTVISYNSLDGDLTWQTDEWHLVIAV